MTEYTTAQVAQMTGKAERSIRKAAQVNKIGRKIGRDWLFGAADIAKIRAIKMGPPKGKRKKKAEPAQGVSDGTS